MRVIYAVLETNSCGLKFPREHGLRAGATDEIDLRFAPGVEAADRTGVAGFARCLRPPPLLIIPDLDVWQGEPSLGELGTGSNECARRIDVVADMLACFLPAWHSGVSGDEAEGSHFCRPLPAVVAPSRSFAVVVLPEVGHL